MKLKDYKNLNENKDITKIPNEAFLLIPDGYTFKVYVYLCGKSINGKVIISLNNLSKELNISKSTIKRSIKWLEDNYFIEKHKTKGLANEYEVYYLDSDLTKEGQEVEITINKATIPKNKHKRKIDYAYTKWRNNVLERDNYTCKMCGRTEDEVILNAHHIERYADNEKLRTDINNGITLCHWCHKEIYGKEKEFEEYFKRMIKENK